MSVKLTVKDRGLKKITSNLTGTKELSVVKVGILEGDKQHKEMEDEDSAPITLGEIGTIHEFGSEDGKIPQRSYIRGTINENKAEINEFANKLYKKVVLGEMNLPVALALLGEKVKALIVKKLDDGIGPDLSIFTIMKRSRNGEYSDKPLIDSGQLKQSINYKVDA